MAKVSTTTSWAPWEALLHWAPFKIDALGLVTLLGAEEVNAAVGRLVSSAYVEYLPLLGAFVIAGDRFTEKAAGFNLYNISEGIHTTDLAAWLTRWMLSQNFEVTRSFVRWKITPPRSRKRETTLSLIISFVLNGFLVAMTLMSRDWYGFANVVAMIVSVIVRAHVLGQQRAAVDAMVDKAVWRFQKPGDGTYERLRYDYKTWKHARKAQLKDELRNRKSTLHRATEDNSPTSSGGLLNGSKLALPDSHRPTRPNAREHKKEEWTGKDTKVLIIQSDSKAVTFWMPNELLIPPSVFIEGPIILKPKRYFAMRSVGWAVFAVHIVAIGMADLATQLYTVVLLVLPTVLLALKYGCDDSQWMATFRKWKADDRHHFSHTTAQNVSQSAGAEEASSGTFQKVRECWIGSRLKAEIYEWPASYEFRPEGHSGVGGPAPAGQERSKKRQDLYAWLALTHDEEESMDKWDLFPHIRKGNNSWWKTYKQKKSALRGRYSNFGPQLVGMPELQPVFADRGVPPQPSTLPASETKPYQMPGRTATHIFTDDSVPVHPPCSEPQARKASIIIQAGSSAYPAFTNHEQDKVDGTVTPIEMNRESLNPGVALRSSAQADVLGGASPTITRVPAISTTAAIVDDHEAGVSESPTTFHHD